MTTILNTIRDTWDSMLGRFAIIALAAGWVPFWLLTEAHAALTR